MCISFPSLRKEVSKSVTRPQAAAHGFHVIAFEPLALNGVALRRSLCANPGLAPRVALHEVALGGGARADCALVSRAKNVGDGTLACGRPAGWQPGGELRLRAGALEFVRLDDALCERHDRDIGFVKLDVEARHLAASSTQLPQQNAMHALLTCPHTYSSHVPNESFLPSSFCSCNSLQLCVGPANLKPDML